MTAPQTNRRRGPRHHGLSVDEVLAIEAMTLALVGCGETSCIAVDKRGVLQCCASCIAVIEALAWASGLAKESRCPGVSP